MARRNEWIYRHGLQRPFSQNGSDEIVRGRIFAARKRHANHGQNAALEQMRENK